MKNLLSMEDLTNEEIISLKIKKEKIFLYQIYFLKIQLERKKALKWQRKS